VQIPRFGKPFALPFGALYLKMRVPAINIPLIYLSTCIFSCSASTARSAVLAASKETSNPHSAIATIPVAQPSYSSFQPNLLLFSGFLH
jgi:hypothetical protein